MHIGACLAISIFSSTPLGGSLSLQGRQSLECDLSQGLLHMLNKHEANPPSATLVRGQSSYLQEQQIHLQSKSVLRKAHLTYTATY